MFEEDRGREGEERGREREEEGREGVDRGREEDEMREGEDRDDGTGMWRGERVATDETESISVVVFTFTTSLSTIS